MRQDGWIVAIYSYSLAIAFVFLSSDRMGRLVRIISAKTRK